MLVCSRSPGRDEAGLGELVAGTSAAALLAALSNASAMHLCWRAGKKYELARRRKLVCV